MAKGKKYTQEFKDSAILLALNIKDSVRRHWLNKAKRKNFALLVKCI